MSTHKGTIPALPKLGQALSKLGFEVQIPKFSLGGDPDSDPDHPGHEGFIRDATVLSTFLDTVAHA